MTIEHMLDQLWDMDAQFMALHHEHGPAVDLARSMWMFVSFPIKSASQDQDELWQIAEAMHEKLLRAIPHGSDAVVKASRDILSEDGDNFSSYTLHALWHFSEIVALAEAGPLLMPPPEPLKGKTRDELAWIVAHLDLAGFSRIALSPYWLSDKSHELVSSCNSLIRTLGADATALSLGGRIGLRLAMGYPAELAKGKFRTATTKAWFSGPQNEICILPGGETSFSHEWMHALEKTSRTHRAGPYNKVWARIKRTRSALRTMSQDHLTARAYLNDGMKRERFFLEDVLTDFFKCRSSEAARERYMSAEKVDRAFLTDLSFTLASVSNQQKRGQVILDTLTPLLAPDAPAVSQEGVSGMVELMSDAAIRFADVMKGISVFEVNARRMDRQAGSVVPYFASTAEMLARSFECYVQPHETIDVLSGSEYDRIMKEMSDVVREVQSLFPVVEPVVRARLGRR